MAIVASVLLNVALIAVYPRTKRLSDTAAMASMLFDLAQVSVLIFLTGGLSNPFAALLLAPVTISASALQLRSVIIVASTALSFIAIMAVWGVPLRFASGEVLQPPPIYIFGVWAALTITVVFMSVYARRIAVETDRMRRAIVDGRFDLKGAQPVNPDGGLKSFGHPIGASGLRMMYEMWLQLRGEAGERQIERPKLGLTHNLGGQPGRCVSFVSIVGN